MRTPTALLVLFVANVAAADPKTEAADIQKVEFVKGTGQVVVHTVEAAAGTIRARCGPSSDWVGPQPEFVFPDEASLRIEFTRRTGDMVIEYASTEDASVAHHVTYPSGNSKCWPLEDDSPRNFAASRMDNDHVVADVPLLVRVGFIDKKPRPRVTIVIREKKTRVDPLSVVHDVPESVPFEERYTNRYVPLLTLTWVRAEDYSLLFERLPSSLWTYAKYDLDKDVVTPLWLADTSDRNLEKIEFPKKNEPLLLVAEQRGTAVVTADGHRFRLASRRAIVAEPDGAIAVPSQARNIDIDVDSGSKYAADALRAKVAEHKERVKKAEACWFKTVKKLGGFTSPDTKMYEVTYRNGEVVSVQDYGSKVNRRAAKKCGVDKYQKAEVKLLRQLRKAYAERAEKRLKVITAKAR